MDCHRGDRVCVCVCLLLRRVKESQHIHQVSAVITNLWYPRLVGQHLVSPHPPPSGLLKKPRPAESPTLWSRFKCVLSLSVAWTSTRGTLCWTHGPLKQFILLSQVGQTQRHLRTRWLFCRKPFLGFESHLCPLCSVPRDYGPESNKMNSTKRIRHEAEHYGNV